MAVSDDFKKSWQAASTNAYGTASDDKRTRAVKFLHRNLVVLVVALMFVVTWAVLGGISTTREEALSEQQGQIIALTSELELARSQVAAEHNDQVAQATGGMSVEHKQADDEMMTELMRQALTWDGLAEYMTLREQIMEDYGFASDSQFMSVFMPGEETGAVRTAPSGETYSTFDTDMSSSFDSLRSYVTGVNADVYSYFTLVQMRVQSSSGAASSTGQVAMTYEVIDGVPANVNAYTVVGGVAESG